MNSRSRELVKRVESIGWKKDGTDRQGHVIMRHDSGAIAHISATPSDWRTTANDLARLERAGGQKLPRANRRRGRVKRQDTSEIEASRRRHAIDFERRANERDAQKAADAKREAEIRALESAERRRREIEGLMR